MAERRMFAKTIVTSDAFLDMPMSARCLYFTLGMFADDDGFVNSPKSIMRQVGASMDDMNILLAKKFVISFESGVIVIKHWRINNYLRSDRYNETKYIEEKSTLEIEETGAYSVKEESWYTAGIPSIDKESKDKISLIEERKKENKENTSSLREKGKSHEEIMDEWELSDMVKGYLKSFLRHCHLNGHTVTNEKLNDILLRLFDYYGAGDEEGMCKSLEKAVRSGYYDIAEGR